MPVNTLSLRVYSYPYVAAPRRSGGRLRPEARAGRPAPLRMLDQCWGGAQLRPVVLEPQPGGLPETIGTETARRAGCRPPAYVLSPVTDRARRRNRAWDRLYPGRTRERTARVRVRPATQQPDAITRAVQYNYTLQAERKEHEDVPLGSVRPFHWADT